MWREDASEGMAGRKGESMTCMHEFWELAFNNKNNKIKINDKGNK